MPHRRAPLTLPLLATLLSAAPLRAAGESEWPQFRGPTGQGVSDATGLPTKWGPTTNVAWKSPVPGRGWSSPVLSNGKLYLTTATGSPGGPEPISLRAVCLNEADGKILWDVEVFRPDPNSARALHQKNSLASPTPVATTDRLYVHFGHLGTAALDLAGNVVWKQESIKFPPVHGPGGSPALVGDKLIFSCDGASEPFLAALDAKTGGVAWKTPRNTHASKSFSFSTPLAIEVGGRTQVISPASGFVGAYDPETGKELWRVGYDEGYSVIPRPAFAPKLGLLFVSSGYDEAVLYAIKPDGAEGDATDMAIAWKTHKGAPNTPSPLVVGDEVYFVADNGVATCADARTGKPHWDERLDGTFSASPVYADGKVYFQTEDGVGYVVKAGKSFELLGENDLGERSLASYAVAGGALYIRTDKHLWKIAEAE